MLNTFLLSLSSCFSDWELQFLEQAQDRHEKISPVWSEVSGGCYVVPGFGRVEMVYFNILKNSQLNREIYGDRGCSQCSTMQVVVPWNLRCPSEHLEVDANSVSLESERLNVGPTAKHGLCTFSFESQIRAWVYRVGSTGTSN